MKLTLGWIVDPTQVYFTLERRVSPPLEDIVRTDAFLDALTAWTSIQRLAKGAIRQGQTAIAGSLGLPTSRQVARLTRAIEQLGQVPTQAQCDSVIATAAEVRS